MNEVRFTVGSVVQVVDRCGLLLGTATVLSHEEARRRSTSGGSIRGTMRGLEGRVPVEMSDGFPWWISPERLIKVSN